MFREGRLSFEGRRGAISLLAGDVDTSEESKSYGDQGTWDEQCEDHYRCCRW
jgi:hypothetical protein